MPHLLTHVWTGLRETRLRVTLLYAHAPSRDDSRVLPDSATVTLNTVAYHTLSPRAIHGTFVSTRLDRSHVCV